MQSDVEVLARRFAALLLAYWSAASDIKAIIEGKTRPLAVFLLLLQST